MQPRIGLVQREAANHWRSLPEQEQAGEKRVGGGFPGNGRVDTVLDRLHWERKSTGLRLRMWSLMRLSHCDLFVCEVAKVHGGYFQMVRPLPATFRR